MLLRLCIRLNHTCSRHRIRPRRIECAYIDIGHARGKRDNSQRPLLGIAAAAIYNALMHANREASVIAAQ